MLSCFISIHLVCSKDILNKKIAKPHQIVNYNTTSLLAWQYLILLQQQISKSITKFKRFRAIFSSPSFLSVFNYRGKFPAQGRQRVTSVLVCSYSVLPFQASVVTYIQRHFINQLELIQLTETQFNGNITQHRNEFRN